MDTVRSLCEKLDRELFDPIQNMMAIIDYDYLYPLNEDAIENEVFLVTENVEKALEGIFEKVEQLSALYEIRELRMKLNDLIKRMIGLMEYIKNSINILNDVYNIPFDYLYQLIMIDTILSVILKKVMNLYPEVECFE